MAIIRASDIGNYLYCRRAWKYRREGDESANRAEMSAGTELHVRHGRSVILSSVTRALGFVFLLTAIILLVTYCTAQL